MGKNPVIFENSERIIEEVRSLWEKTTKLVEEKMKSSITAKEIADKLLVSESWLLRVFKEEVGVTLGKYISDRVLFEAQDRLRYHNMSIREISEDLGYCDRFYFSRAFAKRFGVSPAKYRKNIYT